MWTERMPHPACVRFELLLCRYARAIAAAFLLIACVFVSPEAEGAVTLAVAPFLAQKTNPRLGSAVGETVMSELAEARGLAVVELNGLATPALEYRPVLSGLVGDRTAARIGKLVGARYFLLGAVTRFGSLVVATARLVDVPSSAVLASFECVSSDGTDDLALASRSLAADILATVAEKRPARGNATGDYRYYLYEALGRYNLGNPAASIPLWEKMTRMNPKHAVLRFIFGRILFETGRYHDALLAARQAAASDSSLAEAWVLAGKCSFVTGDSHSATSELEKAIQLAPHLPEPYLLMGRLYKDRRRIGEAADFFARAMDADERYIPAYLALAQLFFEIGSLNEAAGVLGDALGIDPENADALLLLGMTQTLLNEDSKARATHAALERVAPGKAEELRKWMLNR